MFVLLPGAVPVPTGIMGLAVVVLIGIVWLVLAAATMGKADTMNRTAIERVRTSLALVIVLGIGPRAEAQCSASTPFPSTSQRQIQVNLECPGATFFELSETPDFKESDSTGVAIEILNVDPSNEFVDISVTYPAGTPTFPAQPFRMPTETKSPRVLAVLVDFDDGNELTLPQYATPAFLNNLLFSGNHDGRLLYNSLGAWLHQNSYGVVSLAGNVYPGVVHLVDCTNDLYSSHAMRLVGSA
jgi:hypothetical protein